MPLIRIDTDFKYWLTIIRLFRKKNCQAKSGPNGKVDRVAGLSITVLRQICTCAWGRLNLHWTQNHLWLVSLCNSLKGGDGQQLDNVELKEKIWMPVSWFGSQTVPVPIAARSTVVSELIESVWQRELSPEPLRAGCRQDPTGLMWKEAWSNFLYGTWKPWSSKGHL